MIQTSSARLRSSRSQTEEEWTLSLAHSDTDVERYVAVFETFAKDVTGS